MPPTRRITKATPAQAHSEVSHGSSQGLSCWVRAPLPALGAWPRRWAAGRVAQEGSWVCMNAPPCGGPLQEQGLGLFCLAHSGCCRKSCCIELKTVGLVNTSLSPPGPLAVPTPSPRACVHSLSTPCLTLSKLLNLSEPLFPYL